MSASPRISVTIDCRTPSVLMPFWCEALGYVPAPPPAGHATWRAYYLAIGEPEDSLGEDDACDRVVDPEGVRPTIWFQVVPEPKVGKNRVHLDIHVTDRDAPFAERRAELQARQDALLALGGTIREPLANTPDEYLLCQINDPEGNELCLV